MFVDRFCAPWVLLVGLVVLALGCTSADQAAFNDTENSATDNAAQAETKTAREERPPVTTSARRAANPLDRFAVPDGGVPQLLAFIERTMNAHPTTPDEVVELRRRGLPAVKEAAERIEKIATDEDKKLPGYATVGALLLYFRAQDAGQATPREQAALLKDFETYFTDHAEPSDIALKAAQQWVSTLERRRSKDAILANRELGTLLAANGNPAIARWGRKMQGAARRLELPGHEIEVSGTELDGQPFDWSQYQGKVVLVDFWATWCGPCRGELSNVKENYENYHDRGFDVVGISLDSNRQQLEEYLAENEVPWTNLFDAAGWDTPLAEYYGVNSIPRAILVDREGKVVTTDARGNELKEQLAMLLGPPEVAKPETQASGPEATSDAAESKTSATSDDAQSDDAKSEEAPSEDVKSADADRADRASDDAQTPDAPAQDVQSDDAQTDAPQAEEPQANDVPHD